MALAPARPALSDYCVPVLTTNIKPGRLDVEIVNYEL